MPDIIIHIGFPKTATTFLQRNVFPAIDKINYVDYKTCARIFPPLIYLDDLDYDHSEVEKIMEQYMKDETNLFSFEALCGAPFIYKGLGRSRIAGRLKELGFGKIIITVREQVEVIDSIYRQYIVQGGVVKFKDFLNRDKKWDLYRRSFNLAYLNYSKLIDLYKAEFGKDNVLVLTHNELISDKRAYVSKIAEFIGVDIDYAQIPQSQENSSLSNLAINTLRIVNHFIFTSQKPNHLIWNKINTNYVSKIFKAILDPYFFRFFSSKKSYVKNADALFLKEYYKEGNRSISNLNSGMIPEIEDQ